jgi:branched-chain amino acid transport system ATP-binding protein
MDAVLEARGVVKRYGGLVANDGVEMRLRRGEVRGIIGPNGAGKTTFVNLLTGVEKPDAGSIALEGASIVGLAPFRIAAKGLVRSFQVAKVFGNLTVTENLLVPHFAHGPAGISRGLERARELLKLSTLEPLAGAPAKSLSGGQRMLLQACAGFMIPDVKVYVLDEPFAGINPVVKDTLINLIELENRERGTAFLVVSHEMAIVRRLCRIVTVMIAGKVAAEGPLDEIAQREDVIAAYLGRAPA